MKTVFALMCFFVLIPNAFATDVTRFLKSKTTTLSENFQFAVVYGGGNSCENDREEEYQCVRGTKKNVYLLGRNIYIKEKVSGFTDLTADGFKRSVRCDAYAFTGLNATWTEQDGNSYFETLQSFTNFPKNQKRLIVTPFVSDKDYYDNFPPAVNFTTLPQFKQLSINTSSIESTYQEEHLCGPYDPYSEDSNCPPDRKMHRLSFIAQYSNGLGLKFNCYSEALVETKSDSRITKEDLVRMYKGLLNFN